MRLLLALAVLAAAELAKVEAGILDKQYIDVSGVNKFVAPGPGDLRGPCPGLNALANHNFIPHNGIVTAQQAYEACMKVFSMGSDLASFLAWFGVQTSGDMEKFSIGGPPPPEVKNPMAKDMGTPLGLSFSHNKYEVDASPTRQDHYIDQSQELHLPFFKQLYFSTTEPCFKLSDFLAFREARIAHSKANNPYFCYPFEEAIGGTGAYAFPVGMWSNYSPKTPKGCLSHEDLKTFYGVSGTDDNLVYTPGWERIPDDWYKRPDSYNMALFAVDSTQGILAYPDFLSVGGNMGEVDTFVGVNPANISGSVGNLKEFFKGNNPFCFFYQQMGEKTGDLMNGGTTGDIRAETFAVARGLLSKLSCPQLAFWDTTRELTLEAYPGNTQLNPDGTYTKNE